VESGGGIDWRIDVFNGVASLLSGVCVDPLATFAEAVIAEQADCHAPRWRRDGPRRRLDDPQDHVRVEVETALRAGNICVIPVLVRYASMPKPEEVPESVRALVTRHGVSIRPNPDFEGDMFRLAKILRDLIAESRKLRGKQPSHLSLK
jgi:hypothetical protein